MWNRVGVLHPSSSGCSFRNQKRKVVIIYKEEVVEVQARIKGIQRRKITGIRTLRFRVMDKFGGGFQPHMYGGTLLFHGSLSAEGMHPVPLKRLVRLDLLQISRPSKRIGKSVLHPLRGPLQGRI